jgi:hypothetical protein
MLEGNRGDFTEQGIAPASGSKAGFNPVAIAVLIGILLALTLVLVAAHRARRGGGIPNRPSDTRLLNACRQSVPGLGALQRASGIAWDGALRLACTYRVAGTALSTSSAVVFLPRRFLVEWWFLSRLGSPGATERRQASV